ncbi:MAG: TPM domain-containing protein [Alphaproteobacteria bacterium]|nr:TPM domain-containing protein [Alphaproteobacteria bacterium]
MTAVAFAALTFPALTGRVVDDAHVLTADQATILSNRLQTFEDQSGHQMAIATVPSLQGTDIRDFGYQLGRAWALGQKGKNDGVLILVAPTEHKVSIEVGYGLEGDLTDATSSVIISHAMVPKFKAGDYFGGLWSGIDDIEKVIGGQGDQVVQAAQNQSAQAQDPVGAFIFIVFFIIVLLIIFRASRGRGVVFIPGGMGGGSNWSSGGGGWSSGGGGFSGGGGSFGGGGASGGW